MLERLVTLFRPSPPPENGGTWTKVQAMCAKWSKDKYNVLEKWREGQAEAIGGPKDRYRELKKTLLVDVAKAGRKALKLLLELESEYSLADAPGLDSSHVHVDEQVMADLDAIYLTHYSPDGAVALRQCFNMMWPSESSERVREKYRGYLADVQAKLTSLSSSAKCSIRVAAGELRAVGLQHAAAKLGPLFGPVFGRICLPIPTRSMLDDLKTCLEVDEEIMAEVLPPPPRIQMKRSLMPFSGRGLVRWSGQTRDV